MFGDVHDGQRNVKRYDLASTIVTEPVTYESPGTGQNNVMRNKWLSDRLKELGKSQAGLGRALNLPRSRVTDIIKGLRRVTAGEGVIIAQYLEWPHSKVLGMLSDPSALPLNTTPELIELTRIPVIGAVEAGQWREALEYVMDEDQTFVEAPPDPRYPHSRRFALQVRGPSMNLVYPEDSHVIVLPTMDLGDGWRPKNGQRVVVQRTNDTGGVETTVKEFMIREDGEAFLVPRSSDPSFVAWRVPPFWDGDGEFDEHTDNLRVTGLVIQSLRSEP
jgi:repressor LexA